MITVDRLYVRYDDTNILEDINLNLPTGITCAVIGPSGCGKSTLLNVLAGLQKLSGFSANKWRKSFPKNKL